MKSFPWLLLLLAVVRLSAANAQTISTYAGNGFNGYGNNGNPYYSGDNGPAINAQINPEFIAADSKGNIYISQASAYYTVRKIDAKTGIITTVAGNTTRGYSGDGGPATSASLNEPRGIAFDSHDNLYIADYWNNCIRRVDVVTGIITTVAGNGNVLNGYSGDGGPAVDALLFEPFDIAFDGADNLYFTDANNNCIRRIDAKTGIITKVAGSDPPGNPGFSGDGGPAVSATLYFPESIVLNQAGDIIFADCINNRIRKIDAKTGIITTIAGNGGQTYSGIGGPSVDASIYAPFSLALDKLGNVYVCAGANNTVSNQVLKIDVATGSISAFAGNGSPVFSGDGGPPRNAGMAPTGSVFDANGNMFIGDEGNYRVREVVFPVVTASVLTGTISSCLGSASVSPSIQQFTISGAGLYTGLTVTAPMGFEVSLNAGAGFSSSITLSETNGSVRAAAVYVRSGADAPVGNPSGNVVISSNGVAYQSVTVSATVVGTPVLNAVPNQTVTSGQATTEIDFNGTFSTVSWTNDKPGIGLPATGAGDIPSFIAVNNINSPVKATITATPSNANGCTGEAVVFTITINPLVNSTAVLTIPNTFTPNGDGINDNWDIKNIGNYPNCKVDIFNRWGTRIYASAGYAVPWIGQYNGIPLPSGAYYYVIDLRNGQIPLSGWVTIIR